MWSALLGLLAELFASVISDWRRDRALREAGGTAAELKGLEEINERAQKAEAASAASGEQSASGGLLDDDGWKRD